MPGWSPSDSPLFLGCAGLCFLGTAALTLYQSPPATGPQGPRPEIGLSKPLLRVVRICGSVDGVLYLTPLLMYSGVSNAFWSGMFTRQMDPDLVGSSMLILGMVGMAWHRTAVTAAQLRSPCCRCCSATFALSATFDTAGSHHRHASQCQPGPCWRR